MMNKRREVWIGLVAVKQKNDRKPLGKKFKGACVNVLSWANSISKFKIQVKKAVNEFDLIFDEFQKIERLNDRLKNYKLPSHIIKLAKLAKKNKGTYFDEFYCYTGRKSSAKK